MIYTDETLSQFIACQKRITQPPQKKMRLEGKHLRNEMELESLDGNHRFRVFMRQHQDFSENFSIGMEYLPKDEPGSFCLLRCNGVHGGHRVHPHHLSCHIHRSTSDDVNAGLRVERYIEPTDLYADFRGALCYFLRAVNVQETDLFRHFSSLVQGDLFEGETSQ